MKKLLLLGVALLSVAAMPALAEHEGAPHGEEGKPPHHGQMFEKADQDADGKISKDEFMKVHEQRFAEIDKDGDGFLSQEELKAKREEMRGKIQERREQRQGNSGTPEGSAPVESPAAAE